MRSKFARRFGQVVGERRRALGLSQTELAAKLETTHQTVSRWELGWAVPDLRTALRLSDALDFSVDELAEAVSS